jgi:hypothetical protein
MIEEVKRLPTPPFKKSIKIKAKKWLKRFLPAEFTGTITAVAASYIAHHVTRNLIVAAFAGSIGETLGFYTTIIIQDVRIEQRKLRSANKTFSFKAFAYILRNILFDFGFAEIIDSLFIRPFCMYIFPVWIKNYPIGILAGKIASDICFYVPVILAYELRIFCSAKKNEQQH